MEIIIEISIPDSAQITDTIAEQTVTDLKVLNTRIEDNAGKITNAEIKSEPTRFIASTITAAIITAIIRLNALTLVPVARAKFSSNVTANIIEYGEYCNNYYRKHNAKPNLSFVKRQY